MKFGEQLLPCLDSRDFGLDLGQKRRIAQFASLLYLENEKQNLTRIEGVEEFIDGHLVDVLELFKLPTLGNEVVDVGSGSGIPGLLAAAIDPSARKWHLIESETHKASYLALTADQMELKHVQVYADRAEAAIGSIKPDTVIARAVGPVDRIAAWIWNCSTWNNLILFKSRGWAAEWERAKTTRFGKKLTVTQAHEYSIGEKYRVLINLTRS